MITGFDWSAGQAVWVHAFGSFYPGTVVRVGKRRLDVSYATGSGAPHVKTLGFGSELVRPRFEGEPTPPGTRQGATLRLRT